MADIFGPDDVILPSKDVVHAREGMSAAYGSRRPPSRVAHGEPMDPSIAPSAEVIAAREAMAQATAPSAAQASPQTPPPALPPEAQMGPPEPGATGGVEITPLVPVGSAALGGAPPDFDKFKPMRDVVAAGQAKAAQMEATISSLPKEMRDLANKRASSFLADEAAMKYQIDSTKNVKEANALREKLRAKEIAYTRDIADIHDESLIASGHGDELPIDRRAMIMPAEASDKQSIDVSKYTNKFVMAPSGNVFLKGKPVNAMDVAKSDAALAHFLDGGATVSQLKRETGAAGVLQDLTGEGKDIDTLLADLKARSEYTGKYESRLATEQAKTLEIHQENVQAALAKEWDRLKGKDGKVAWTTKMMNEVGGANASGFVSALSFAARAIGTVIPGSDKLADEWDKTLERLQSPTPESEQGWDTMLASGAGSMLSSAGTSGILSTFSRLGKGAKFLAWVASGSMESAQEANNTYTDLRSRGASTKDARVAMFGVFFANMALNPMLDKIGIFNKEAGSALKRMARSAGAEATQEAAQQVIQNIAEGKPWQEGVKESAIVGGVLGAAATGGHQISRSAQAAALKAGTAERHARQAERLAPMREYMALTRGGVELTNKAPGAVSQTTPTTVSGLHMERTSTAPTTGATVNVQAAIPSGAEERIIPGKPTVEPTTAPEPTAAPTPVLQQAREQAQAEVNKGNIIPFRAPHEHAVNVVNAFGPENKVIEGEEGHTEQTAHTAANRGVATTLFSIMADGVKSSTGSTEINDEQEAQIKNTISGLGMVFGSTKEGGKYISGPQQVAQHMTQLGVDPHIVDAFKDTIETLKAKGLDFAKRGKAGPLPAKESAERSWAFLNEFKAQLQGKAAELGVKAPTSITGKVNEDGSVTKGAIDLLTNLTKPGGKYSNAYHRGLGLEAPVAVAEHVSTAPTVKEIPHAQTGERPTSPQAAVEAAPKPSAERPGLQEGRGEVEAPGVRPEAGRDAGSVLGKTSETHATELEPWEAELFEKAKASLVEETGVDDVQKLHDEIVGEPVYEKPGEEHAGAPMPKLYGPSELLYPANALAPGSPFKRVFNLTNSVFLSNDFMRGLGFAVRSDATTPGSSYIAQLATMPKERAAKVEANLKRLGFDAIAYTNEKGGADIMRVGEQEEAAAAPTKFPAYEVTSGTVRQSFANRSTWVKHPDGHWGFKETKVNRLTPAETEAALRAAETEKPVEEGEPVKVQPPIKDKIEREQAVEDGRTMVANNHLTVNDLLTLAKSVGAPVSTADFQHLINQGDLDTGMKSESELVGVNRSSDYVPGITSYTPGQLHTKLMDYAKDAGVTGITEPLWKAKLFPIGGKARTAEADLKGAMRVAISPEMIASEAERKAYRAYLASDTQGSQSAYAETRQILTRLVNNPRSSNDLINQINSQLKEGKLSLANARVLGLAIAANAAANPGFFSKSEAQVREMEEKDKDLRKSYDEGLPPLAPHFDARPEAHESFMVSDAEIDPRGNNFVEPTPSREIKKDRAERASALTRVIQQIAERGGFTPEALATAGVQERPKAQHRASYDAAVNMVESNPEATATLEKRGLSHLLQPRSWTPALIRSGYAHTRILFEAGLGKQPFDIRAFTVDPNFETFYTPGEDVIRIFNFATQDGMPIDANIMNTREIGILMDQNHPMHDQTIENVLARTKSAGDVVLSGTRFESVTVDVPAAEGRAARKVSMLVPTARLIADNYAMRQTLTDVVPPVDTATGVALIHEGMPSKQMAPPTVVSEADKAKIKEAESVLFEAHRIVAKDQAKLAARGSEAVDALRAKDPRWADRLGANLNDQIMAAQNILSAIDQYRAGDKAALRDLPESQRELAAKIMMDTSTLRSPEGVPESREERVRRTMEEAKTRASRLESMKSDIEGPVREFVKAANTRLAYSQDPVSQAARARAREIRAVLERSKSDITWDGVFAGPSGNMAVSIPVQIPENCVRNREQFLAVAEQMGVDKNDPATKHLYDALAKIDDVFFEELGTNISQDPALNNGAFDSLHRIIKIAGNLKTRGFTSTTIARTMTHELAHAMTAYMGLPMQNVATRWFYAERQRFIDDEIRKTGKSLMGDILNADSVVNIHGEDRSLAVKDALEQGGSLRPVMITRESAEALLAIHGKDFSKAVEPVFGPDGVEEIGYKLKREFFKGDRYRYTNLGEFIAETMADEIADHASTIRKGGRKATNAYTQRLHKEAGAWTAMDALHRNMGRTIDALIGKNTMRRFVGYLVNEGGKLDTGLMRGGKAGGAPDFALPQMEFKGNDKTVFYRGREMGGPPITPVEQAKSDHMWARDLGWLVNHPRAMAMKALNAATVSDKARVAAYAMRGVLGELGINYNSMASGLYSFYDRAHELTKIDKETRNRLIQGVREGAGEGKSQFVKLIDGYYVHIDDKGNYVDAISAENVQAWDDYEKTGKFTGPLAGLEAKLKPLNDTMWGRLSMAVANLAQKLDVPTDQLTNFEEEVKKVTNYLPHQYATNHVMSPIEQLMGKRRQDGVKPEAEAGLSTYNSSLDPAVDFGINAHMLMERKFGTYKEAIEKGHFPAHVNAVDNIVSGMANTMGVIARMDALTALLDRSLAVPAYDGGATTRAWGTLKLKTIGLTEEMFGKELADIRIDPDAARVLDYAFRPDFLSGTSVGRAMAQVGGVMNVFQLFGLNDYVNGMATVSGFGAARGQTVEKQLADAEKRAAVTKTVRRTVSLTAAGLGAAAGVAALGVGTGAAVAGAGAAYLGVKAMSVLINKAKIMVAGTPEAIREGRAAMGIIQSAMNPDRLPRAAKDFLAFAQMANVKVMENPIQIARMGKLVDEAMRQGKPLAAAAYWVGNLLNKPTQYNDIGIGNVGGKALAKLGMIKMLAPAIMDKYRLPNGEVDWTNKGLVREAAELSDDMDNQVGAIQYRNLHMNPTIVSTMKTLFRAFGFRYTTERMKTLVAADIVNNLGMAGPWRGAYQAFRESATGGGTDRPMPMAGSNFAWRKGTVAMAMLMLAASMAARLQAMMSHVLWPDANYTQSDFARRSYEQLLPVVGRKPALAFEGFLSFLPPEGSSAYDAMRHLMYEVVSPQVGHDDPTIGTPNRMAVPGTMYARNLVEHPFSLTPTWEAQQKAFGSWFMSGLNPPVTLAMDMMRGKDALGRPIGWGAPFNRFDSFNAYNAFFEKHPEDGFATNLLKAQGRNFAHTISSSLPFFARDIVEYQPGGSWFKSASQALGGRAMPQEASLTEAGAAAFGHRYGGVNEHQTMDTVRMNAAMRPAKVQMSETGDTSKLDELYANGEIDKDTYSRVKRDYVDKQGNPRPSIVRHLRGVMDKEKNVTKEVWLMANPKQRAQILDYLSETHGSGYSKVAKERIQGLKDWIARQETK